MSGAGKTTTDAVEILWHRYFEGKPEMVAMLEKEMINARIASAVYDLRKRLRLSQRNLAERVGTTPSAIGRLEESCYNGDAVKMLRRIADACGQELVLDIRLESRNGAKRQSP